MDDKTWATIAVQLGVINPGLAEEFQRTKEQLGLTKSLPDVLKENGLINDGDIEAVAALEPVHLHGALQNDYQREQQAYALKCVNAGLINEEQATECLRDLVIEGQNRHMKGLLVERHYVKEEQIEALEKPAAPAPVPKPAPAPAPAPKPAVVAKPPAPALQPDEIDLMPLDDKPEEAKFEPIEMDLTIDLDGPPPPPPAPTPVAPPAPKVAPAVKPAAVQTPAKPAAAAPAPAPAPSPATAALGTKKKMKCVKCKLTLEVITRAKAPNCPKCKIPLEDIGFSPQLKTDATYTTVRLKAVNKDETKTAPAPAPAPVAGRHQCKICDTRFDAEPEPGGRLHCPTCGASFMAR